MDVVLNSVKEIEIKKMCTHLVKYIKFTYISFIIIIIRSKIAKNPSPYNHSQNI